MGVPVGEADGEHLSMLRCGECGNRYETDETLDNDCPYCNRSEWDLVDFGDPSTWRDD
jgi:rubrerythrin